MKRIHTFIINKEIEVEQQTESKNEAGEIVITKKKEKQLIPHSFFIARPTRTLADQANLYNSVVVNQGLKSGLLSVFSLDKKYKEDGVFTEEDNKKYKDLCDILIKNVEELQKIAAKKEEEKGEEDKIKLNNVTEEITQARLKLRDYENIRNNLYVHSAEYRARNMTITWWVLHLSYKDEMGKEIPFFIGNTFDDKIKFYDQLIDQEDPFIKQVIDKFMYIVAFWIINNTDKQEDFAELDKFIETEQTKTAAS